MFIFRPSVLEPRCFLHVQGCPAVDLLIRTSGESRLSDYLIWQSGQALIHFTPVLWPEFSFWELLVALVAYQRAAPSLEAARAAAQRRAGDCQCGPTNEDCCCCCGTATAPGRIPERTAGKAAGHPQTPERIASTATPQQQHQSPERTAGTATPQHQSPEGPTQLNGLSTANGVGPMSCTDATPGQGDGLSTGASSERYTNSTEGTGESRGEEAGGQQAPATGCGTHGGSATESGPPEQGGTALRAASRSREEATSGATGDGGSVEGGTEGKRDTGAGISNAVGAAAGAPEGGAHVAARTAPKRRRGTRGTTQGTADAAGDPELAWAAPPRVVGHEEDPVPGCACCVVQQLRFHAACTDPVPGLKALMEKKRARDAAARAAAAG